MGLPKLTEAEQAGHKRACVQDACKLYGCRPSDLHLRPLRGGALSIRLKNAALKGVNNG